MRSLIITQNVTLDGSVEMLEGAGWFDPQSQDDELLAEMTRQDSTADALLVGRKTFEDFRGYWPSQLDDITGITDYLNNVEKYVVSSSMTDPKWENSTILSGDPADEAAELKAAEGGDIVVTGSISLCHALIEAEVVDEYRLFIYPFVQGGGRRLFPDRRVISGFTPVAQPIAFPSGVVFVRWGRNRAT
ncbi:MULTISPECIES: dihydrofolate reductase family protein [Mycobacterium]|jgi:dihydrofolate reductase|uniref:Dihydrofolate reductase n=2 Tax=Mycobacterium TaxID=1763 RepID=A0A1Y0C3Z9_9MYCO|nr:MULTISPECIES: dihydrofolate reductase family protein [Mycobacterium]ART69872.1 dihydrofolate reductase [Mycobacterium dioxanotrophicus]ORA21243.1 dihydrofolate reductase [Mycobacterium aquaticum]